MSTCIFLNSSLKRVKTMEKSCFSCDYLQLKFMIYFFSFRPKHFLNVNMFTLGRNNPKKNKHRKPRKKYMCAHGKSSLSFIKVSHISSSSCKPIIATNIFIESYGKLKPLDLSKEKKSLHKINNNNKFIKPKN